MLGIFIAMDGNQRNKANTCLAEGGFFVFEKIRSGCVQKDEAW
jgi:hypothetical protein